MNRKITELYVLTGFFAVLIIGSESTNSYDTIVNIIYVIILISIQLVEDYFKRNRAFFNLLELLLIVILKSIGRISLELFVPIIIYEVFKASYMNYLLMIFFSIASFILFHIEFVNYIIFCIIINLYLYEADKQYKDKLELKKLNKMQSAIGFMLQEKMLNMNKYLEQKDVVAALKERNYMAQKIHDHLGHRITSSIMQLEVTKETLGKDNEVSRKYLLSAMDSLRRGMEEIRVFLRNAKPGDKVVSIEEIKKQFLEFQYSTNIKTHLDINGNIDRINMSVMRVIEENLREALTNAAKYSNASNIYLSINIYNKFLRVEIRDDGSGVENINKSLGLKGMEERIESIGGRIQFYNDAGFAINMIINI